MEVVRKNVLKMNKTFTIHDTMKVKNISDMMQYSIVDNHQVIKFEPGEIKEFPTDYIYLNKEGKYVVKKWYLEVIETLPDLLEVGEPINSRWEILDLRKEE